MDAAILADTGLSVLQKKALRTRLGIQKNTLLMDEQKVPQTSGFCFNPYSLLRREAKSENSKPEKKELPRDEVSHGQPLQSSPQEEDWGHVPEEKGKKNATKPHKPRSETPKNGSRKSNLGEVFPLKGA